MNRFIFAILLMAFCQRAICQDSAPITEVGLASYYSKSWNGRRTSSGEKLHDSKYTAAHKTLPFGTIVRVTNTENCKWVLVKINDRGPFVKRRVIDLSWGAANELSLIQKGLGEVEVDVVTTPFSDKNQVEK